ncbi:MAG TPA: polyphenol oxidase family protein [Gemmatimonadales bacterium]|nr:polyphenol oxidase family protein [Gemmatimonadales bacterium]
MTTDLAVREHPVSGPVPRYEVPAWRERYGLVAGITARGDAAGPGFDLGLWTGEPVREVMGRWREFRQSLPGFTAFVMGHQAHGTELAWHGPGRGWTVLDGVDGHLTTEPGTLLLVTVADCVPVYLAVPGRAAALLHAGWRGAAAGILERGVRALAQHAKASVSDIVMHCGVGICGSCYEVGSEVLTRCGLPAPGSGPWHLDLRGQLRERAAALGVHRVTVSAWCSAHDRPHFYSHRGSRGRDGRMVAYLGVPIDGPTGRS